MNDGQFFFSFLKFATILVEISHLYFCPQIHQTSRIPVPMDYPHPWYYHQGGGLDVQLFSIEFKLLRVPLAQSFLAFSLEVFS